MRNKFVILIAILAGLLFWSFTGNPMVATDLHFTFQEELIKQFTFPYTWGSGGAVGLGEYAVFILWSWPIHFLFGALAKMGLTYNLLIKLFTFALVILLGYYSINKLLTSLKISSAGRLVGSLLFLLNTYLILLIDGGQINLAISYSVLPLTLFYYLKSETKSNREDRIKYSVSVLLISFFDIRIIYFVAMITSFKLLFDLFYEKGKKKVLLNFLATQSIVLIILPLAHSYWIFPAIFSKAPGLPSTYSRGAQTQFLNFTSLGHSFYFLQPHWFKNVFGKIIEVKAEFILIPVFVFLAPVLRKKSKAVGFWLLIALVSVFLTKGSNPPLAEVYTWLFTNIPGFSLFRDSTKFFFLVALSYSVLLGVTTDELVKKFDWSFKFSSVKNWKIAIIPLALVLYLVFLARPVWLGKMTGTFSKPAHKEEYFKAVDIIREDNDFGRIFWIPTKAPLGYSSSKHPSVEAARLYQQRPFAIGVVGTYETFNFLREAPFMGEVFEIAGIRYITYPFPDERREELKEDNIVYHNAFLDQLTNLDWVEKRLTEPPVSLLKTKEDVEHIFASPNTFFVVGSDRIYWELVEIEDFDLPDNSLIFAEEQPASGEILEEIDEETTILFDKKEIDLVATKIDREKFIFPAANLDFDPDETGWWKREAVDLIRWRDFLQQKYQIDNLDFDYGGGWAVSEGQNELEVTNKNIKKGNTLLARVMESSKGGLVEFYQGQERIGEVDTKLKSPEDVEIKLTGYEEIPDQYFNYDNANVRWFEVGELSEDQRLTIKTEGDINVVNSLVSVDKEKLEELAGKVNDERIIVWSELTPNEKEKLFSVENSPKVTYERISPTHYKVDIKGLQEPTTIAFSETYDPPWKVDGQNSYPLYSLINGFYIESDGEYDIIFEPQKHVLPGLIVSGLTFIGVIGTLIILRRKA